MSELQTLPYGKLVSMESKQYEVLLRLRDFDRRPVRINNRNKNNVTTFCDGAKTLRSNSNATNTPLHMCVPYLLI